MKDLLLIGCGFMGGAGFMGCMILWVDNREWVRELKRKHNIGGYQPLKDTDTSPPKGGSGVPSHKDFPEIKTNDWASRLSNGECDEYEKRFL